MKRFLAVAAIVGASVVMLVGVGRVVRFVRDGRATDEELRAEREANQAEARAAFAAPAPPTPAEAADFDRFFRALGTALADRDEAAVTGHFDADRLTTELVRFGVFARLKAADTPANRADVARGFRSAVGKALVENEFMRWQSSRVRAIRWAADGREAVVIATHRTEIADEELDQRMRWWLVGRAGHGWKAYDIEDLDMGSRVTQMLAAVATPELVAAGPAGVARIRDAALAVREAQMACIRPDAVAAEEALARARGVDLPAPAAALRSVAEAGLALLRRDHAAVLRHLDEADRFQPGMLGTKPLRASALNFAGRHEEALEQARGYVAELGPDPASLTQSGYALEALGQPAEAAADYRRALDEFPDQLDSLFGLRRVLPPEEKAEVGERLAKARHPDRLFDELLDDARDDDDDAGAAALLAGLRKAQPDHPRVAEEEVRELVRDGKYAEATALVRSRGTALQPRPPVVNAYLFAMLDAGRSVEALEGVPAAHAGAAFQSLALSLDGRRFDEKDDAPDTHKEQREALFAARRKQAPRDPWVRYYEASAREKSKNYDEAAKGFAAAAAELTAWDDVTDNDRDLYRIRRVSALYRAKNGLEALREVGPANKTFPQLGYLYLDDRDADGLAALVAAHAGRQPADRAVVYFRGEVHWLKEEYAAAAKAFGEYRRGADEKDDPYAFAAADREVRSFVRAGDTDGAREAVGLANRMNWRHRALIAAAGGDAAELGRVLEEQADQPGGVGSLYYDDDFARRFAAPAFEALRRKYPDPRPPLPGGPVG